MTPPTNTTRTLCPTCGYPRKTFASDEGTGGFVPYKPVDSSQPIDIESEMMELPINIKTGEILYEDLLPWANSLCERVEESTIKRCEIFFLGVGARFIKRIYSTITHIWIAGNSSQLMTRETLCGRNAYCAKNMGEATCKDCIRILKGKRKRREAL